VVTVKSVVNGIVSLMASGGSTNHAIHLVAMARTAGVRIDWEDMAELSAITPLLARVYPNGVADVNHFHAAGGVGFLFRELIEAGLMHADVMTVSGESLLAHTREPTLEDGRLVWRDAPAVSGDLSVLRPVSDPFEAEGGLRRVEGNLGRAVIKTSAVRADRRSIRAPARVFDSQQALEAAFKAGELNGQDFVAVVRFQGPRANGMPELHKLTPPLSVLQDRGQRVALVTDGRMSGASGTVLAAIHVTPEALPPAGGAAGPLARVQDGDIVYIDAASGLLEAEVPAEVWSARVPAVSPHGRTQGTGRELFELFRAHADDAERGASPLF
jgi:phosphogluconate dehydratase